MSTGFWSAYLPESGTNLVPNPSFETNTTSWAAAGPAGTTLTRVLTYAAKGHYSCAVTTNSGGAGQGAMTDPIVATAGTSYTASVYLRDNAGAGGAITLAIAAYSNAAGTTWLAEGSVNLTLTAAQQRITVTYTAPATTVSVRVMLKTQANVTITWYVDGVQLEALAYETSYIDGDQPGCQWTGTAHGSTSVRSAQYRGGGRLVNIVDYCDVNDSFFEQGAVGVGMPPLATAESGYATLPGGQYQGSKAEVREFTLAFLATGTSATRHAARSKLRALFDPFAVSPVQPIKLQYTGNTDALEIEAAYVAGLEWAPSAGRPEEEIAVRLRAHDPWFYETVQDSIASAAHERKTLSLLLTDTDGIYANLSATMGTVGNVYALCATDSYLYIGGSFVNVGDASGDRIVRYAWATGAISSMGSGLNGDCNALYWDGSNLIVGGAFTSAGGVANTRGIAYWDGANWQALGTGCADGLVYCIDGDLATSAFAIGGTFTGVGGVANTKGLAQWSAAAWHALTDGTLNAQGATGPDVRAICAFGGAYWVSGFFAKIDALVADNLAYRSSGGTWSSIGNINVAGHAWSIARGDDGTIYLGGTGITSIGGISGTGLFSYYESTWHAIVTQSSVIWRVRCWDGEVWIAGDALEVYRGSAVVGRPTALPGAARSLTRWGNKRYIGVTGSDTIWSSKRLTVTNGGTALAYPDFRVPYEASTTAAYPRLIINETTGHLLWLNAPALVSGAYLDIDLDYRPDPLDKASPPGRKRISNQVYDVLSTILKGSDLGTFALVPGVNDLTLYTAEAAAEATPTNVSVIWRTPHAGVDE